MRNSKQILDSEPQLVWVISLVSRLLSTTVRLLELQLVENEAIGEAFHKAFIVCIAYFFKQALYRGGSGDGTLSDGAASKSESRAQAEDVHKAGCAALRLASASVGRPCV